MSKSSYHHSNEEINQTMMMMMEEVDQKMFRLAIQVINGYMCRCMEYYVEESSSSKFIKFKESTNSQVLIYL